MKVLVCGDRNWTDRAKIEARLKTLPSDAIILAGGAKGADTIAAELATERGLNKQVFMADWTRYGKSAGMIRNRQMLNEGPMLVIAFHSDIETSKGTKDCVTEAIRRGISVEIHA